MYKKLPTIRLFFHPLSILLLSTNFLSAQSLPIFKLYPQTTSGGTAIGAYNNGNNFLINTCDGDKAQYLWTDAQGNLLDNQSDFASSCGQYRIDANFYIKTDYVGTEPNRDIRLRKLGRNGIAVWERTYPLALDNIGQFVIPTSDGGFLATGITQISNDTTYKIQLIKTDANGTKQWEKVVNQGMKYSPRMFDPSRGPCSGVIGGKTINISNVGQTSDGGFFIQYPLSNIVFSCGFGGGTGAGLIRLDANGNYLWSKIDESGSFEGKFHKVAPADNGNLILLYSRSAGDSRSCTSSEYSLIKFSASGNALWSFSRGGSTCSQVRPQFATVFSNFQNGDILLESQGMTIFRKINGQTGQQMDSMSVMPVDSARILQAMTILPDGSFVITGAGDGTSVWRTFFYKNKYTPSVSSGICASKSLAPWELWISNVKLGTLNNTSDKFKDYSTLGYSDYTNLSTTVTKGQTYPLSITSGLSWDGNLPNVFYRVWIDWNQNKIFDRSELVYQNIGINPITTNFQIPNWAVEGSTRMRVAVKWGAYPTECETFERGEVEDYTINIQNTPICNNITSGGEISGNEDQCAQIACSFCPGSGYTATTISNKTSAAGGSGNLEYIWVKNTSNIPSSITDGIIIENATADSLEKLSEFAISNKYLTQTTHFRRFARRVGCIDYMGSNGITKNVRPITAPLLICPKDTTIILTGAETCYAGSLQTARLISQSPCDLTISNLSENRGTQGCLPIGINAVRWIANFSSGGFTECSYNVSVTMANPCEKPLGQGTILCYSSNNNGSTTLNIADGNNIVQKTVDKNGTIQSSQTIGSLLQDSILVKNNQIIKKLVNGTIAFTKNITPSVLNRVKSINAAVEMEDGSFVMGGFQKYIDTPNGIPTSRDSLILVTTDANLNFQDSFLVERNMQIGYQFNVQADTLLYLIKQPNNRLIVVYNYGVSRVINSTIVNLIKIAKVGSKLSIEKREYLSDHLLLNKPILTSICGNNLIFKATHRSSGGGKSSTYGNFDYIFNLDSLFGFTNRFVGGGSTDYYGSYYSYSYTQLQSINPLSYRITANYAGDNRIGIGTFQYLDIRFYDNTSTTEKHKKTIPFIAFDHIVRTGDTTCLVITTRNGSLYILNPDCNNTSTATPDLALSLTATPSVFRQWTNTNFNISIKNKGNQAFTNIKIHFPFPEKTVTGSKVTETIGSWREYCVGSIRCFEWTIPNLAANTTATLDIPLFILDAVAPITATAKLLTSTPSDNNTANNNASVTINPASAAPQASLSVQKPTQLIPLVIQNISPTYTEGDIVVDVESLVEKSVRFDFFNIQGKLIKSENRGVKKGENKLYFELFDAQQGMYLLKTDVGTGRGTPLKFIKM